ncbi:uncharacterized protein LAJ45_05976 [Morchella importuna]|uniref:uncharacterized protein n=1 Tax=Morchella importuna TaxID=1174673 RepID=UPI001E8E55C0|nr:uncharacterized protein LAJ45_05976 [Morchella importuna]KAH8149824.1 hypothetical protein LAJ45_05976 [Morchella importuna]
MLGGRRGLDVGTWWCVCAPIDPALPISLNRQQQQQQQQHSITITIVFIAAALNGTRRLSGYGRTDKRPDVC